MERDLYEFTTPNLYGLNPYPWTKIPNCSGQLILETDGSPYLYSVSSSFYRINTNTNQVEASVADLGALWSQGIGESSGICGDGLVYINLFNHTGEAKIGIFDPISLTALGDMGHTGIFACDNISSNVNMTLPTRDLAGAGGSVRVLYCDGGTIGFYNPAISNVQPSSSMYLACNGISIAPKSMFVRNDGTVWFCNTHFLGRVDTGTSVGMLGPDTFGVSVPLCGHTLFDLTTAVISDPHQTVYDPVSDTVLIVDYVRGGVVKVDMATMTEVGFLAGSYETAGQQDLQTDGNLVFNGNAAGGNGQLTFSKVNVTPSQPLTYVVANWLSMSLKESTGVYHVDSDSLFVLRRSGITSTPYVYRLYLDRQSPDNGLFKTVRITDSSSPLTYTPRGVFYPANINNGGMKSKIGWDPDSVNLEWSFNGDEPFLLDGGQTVLTFLQSFAQGLWQGGFVRWWRTLMPTYGDCDTLGAVQMFRGRISAVDVDRLKVKVTVNSILEIFKWKVPTQTIEPSNRAAQYGPGISPITPGNLPAQYTQFECIPGMGGGIQRIVAGCTAPNLGETFPDGTYNMGYMQWTSGPLQGLVSLIQRSGGPNPAGQITVAVGGRTQPWSVAANPTMPYGFGDGVDPVVVPLPMTPGHTLTITANGSMRASDSRPYVGPAGQAPPTGSTQPNGVYYPSHYIVDPTNLIELIGVFVTFAGVVVGAPFVIGTGVSSLVIPVGADRLQLAVNDDHYRDNNGSYIVTVVDSVLPTSGLVEFFLAKPLFFDPHPDALTFTAFIPVPLDSQISGDSTMTLPGFPYVPTPEQAL
jgi:hypothetical protein